jgi:hypothetical protein
MNKDEARALFIDYMYGGLDIDTQDKLEEALNQHSDLREELDGLMQTREMLALLPEQTPGEQFVLMDPSETKSTLSIWLANLWSSIKPQTGLGRFSMAMASFLFLFIVMGAATNMNLLMENGNFSLNFGEQTPAQVGYSAAQVEMIINQVQAENAELVADIVEAAQEQQELQFQQTLANFASYLDDQRNNDLQLIDYSLSSLEETTYNRFVQTDQVLGEIIQTVSSN